jgi:hypothetical protein
MPVHKRNKLVSDKRNPNTDPNQAMVYQIRLEGHLDQTWCHWLGSMTLTLEDLVLEDNGDTVLSCIVAHQSALYGLLKKSARLRTTPYLGHSRQLCSGNHAKFQSIAYQPIARDLHFIH